MINADAPKFSMHFSAEVAFGFGAESEGSREVAECWSMIKVAMTNSCSNT